VARTLRRTASAASQRARARSGRGMTSSRSARDFAKRIERPASGADRGRADPPGEHAAEGQAVERPAIAPLGRGSGRRRRPASSACGARARTRPRPGCPCSRCPRGPRRASCPRSCSRCAGAGRCAGRGACLAARRSPRGTRRRSDHSRWRTTSARAGGSRRPSAPPDPSVRRTRRPARSGPHPRPRPARAPGTAQAARDARRARRTPTRSPGRRSPSAPPRGGA
jgi:hypothetical protein